MLDRFLINQRSWILSGTLLLFALFIFNQVNQRGSLWANGLALLLGLGFSLYNALFVTNWHHLSERLIAKIQRWRSRVNLPTLTRKKVWYQQKMISFIGIVIGMLCAITALLSLLQQTPT